jgi:hypothetical protein
MTMAGLRVASLVASGPSISIRPERRHPPRDEGHPESALSSPTEE